MNIVDVTSISLFVIVPILFLAVMIRLAARTNPRNKWSGSEQRRKQLHRNYTQSAYSAARELSDSKTKRKTESADELSFTNTTAISHAEHYLTGSGEPRPRPVAISGGRKGQRPPSPPKQGNSAARRSHLRRIK